MIYRDYGKTGKKVSLLGFGSMRFKNIDSTDECVEMMLEAAGEDTYDHGKLHAQDEAMLNRLRLHWGVQLLEVEKCIECGQCEERCTQHLPTIERLIEIARVGKKSKEKSR